MIKLQISSPGKVFRRVGESFHEESVEKVIKHPTQVMIWGIISSKGLGELYFVDGHMKTDQYVKVLKERVKPQMKKWFTARGRRPKGLPKAYFMQDGAPCHTSRISMGVLNGMGINIFKWPGNSPDMNPIENVWNVLKIEVRKKVEELKQEEKKKHQKGSKKEKELDLLKRAITICWNESEIVKRTAIQSCKSMERRIKLLRRCSGRWTKY
jgi:transposase